MAKPDQSLFCKGCWSQMHVPIPIHGPLSVPLRVFGIGPSKMNPNACTICERAFATVKRSRQISAEVSILFADLRGYTRLTERIGAAEVSPLLRAFHEQCAQAIWQRDGIVNKSMGDGLLAIFNFPITADDHTRRAVAAAIDIQRDCAANLGGLKDDLGVDADDIGVGVGIASGTVEIGEFSVGHAEYTAIGSVVNLAARLESSAGAGEILLSDSVYAGAREQCRDARSRTIELKGFDDAVHVHALSHRGAPSAAST